MWIRRFGAPGVLSVEEAPDPEPGPGEVRVRVEAIGVNFADTIMRAGLYQDAPPRPFVPGYEAAGRIDALGPGVAEARLGERVVLATPFGGYTDCLVRPAEQALPVPEGLSAVEAASLPVVGLTAWMILERCARVREGDRVLVHSAGGSVGLMALDLLRWRGAYAIGTASGWKHEELRALGYDQLIDYRDQDYAEVLRSEPGLDLILDPLGGGSWKKGIDLLAPGGKLCLFGVSGDRSSSAPRAIQQLQTALAIPWLRLNPVALIQGNRGLFGVNMARLFDQTELLSGWLREILELARQGVVRPRVHAEVPFEEPWEAHRILEARENFGKVVLVVGQG